MRVTKFRAWDKERHSMFTVFDSTSDTEWYLPNVKEGYEIMQYIGLQDKNGTDIYEGDVLKVPDWYDLPENTSMTYNNQIIDFKNGSFCMKDEPVYDDHEYISEECEVIGNIHENPGLITE